jgi:hypothetical protein
MGSEWLTSGGWRRIVLRNREIATAGSSRRGIGYLNAWRILMFGLLLAGSVFCSKKHEAPVAFHRTLLDTPSDVEAEFVAGQRIVVTWTIVDETNVAGYVVSVSDSTEVLRESLVTETTYTVEETSLKAEGFDADTWVFYQVSAVDDRLFRGPASAVDSLLIR